MILECCQWYDTDDDNRSNSTSTVECTVGGNGIDVIHCRRLLPLQWELSAESKFETNKSHTHA